MADYGFASADVAQVLAHMPASEASHYRSRFRRANDLRWAEWPLDPAIRKAIVDDNKVRPDYARIRVPVLAIYRTETMEQTLKDYPPINQEQRAALNQSYAGKRARLSKWQRDLLAGVPTARIVELPDANLIRSCQMKPTSFVKCARSRPHYSSESRRAVATQPGISGEYAEYPVPVFSITIRNFMASIY